jgi:hypothetical protein
MAGNKDEGSKRGEAAKVGASASRASAKAAAKAGKTGPGATSSKRGRGKPAPVKKPFPVGFAAGVAVLVLFLGSILAYAATNVGSGFEDALEKADKNFSALRKDDNLSANHVNAADGTRVDYPNRATTPPDGGNHSGYWQKCGPYTAPLVNEHAVHSLEHGATWITYKPDLPADQVKVLTDLVATNPEYGLLSPYLGQTAPVMATAWGRQITAQSASDPQLTKFMEVYAGGPQQREQAGCATGGAITNPGTVPFVTQDGQTFTPGPATGPLVPASGSLPTPSPLPTGLGGTTTPTATTAPSVAPSASATAPTSSPTP